MKQSLYYFTLLLWLVPSTCLAQLSVEGYTNHELHGFDVLLEDRANAMDEELTQKALDLLESKLLEITQLGIGQEKMDSMLAIPIFMDWNTTTGAAQYHPSREWLLNNDYLPQKAKCVEISNIKNFFDWTNQNQPYMVLHELAHAYHHRVLNYNSAVITNAFDHAVSSKLYTNIKYHLGSGNYSTAVKAYALNNEFEFFAELTEAYFGLNDYYPFDREDLKEYDEVGYEAMVSIWEEAPSSFAASANRPLVSLYPNPTQGSTTIDLGAQSIDWQQVRLIDLSGKMVSAPIKRLENGTGSIDLADCKNGLYFIEIRNKGGVKQLPIIKN